MNNKTRISLSAGIAIATFLIGYFAIIPAFQINDYKQSAAKHAAVNAQMVRVYDNFQSGAFTNLDSKAASDKADIESGRAAVKDATTIVDANEPALTKFKALPLLSWNKKYKTATDIDNKETAFIKKAQSLLKDYTELLDYSAKSIDLNDKAEKATDTLNTINDSSTPTQIATKIETSANQLQPIIEEQKALTPPDYLVEAQTANIKASTNLLTILRSLIAAIRTLDIKKLTTLAAQMEQSLKDLTKQGQDVITKLHTDSRIQLDIVELRLLNNQITKDYAAL